MTDKEIKTIRKAKESVALTAPAALAHRLAAAQSRYWLGRQEAQANHVRKVLEAQQSLPPELLAKRQDLALALSQTHQVCVEALEKEPDPEKQRKIQEKLALTVQKIQQDFTRSELELRQKTCDAVREAATTHEEAALEALKAYLEEARQAWLETDLTAISRAALGLGPR